MPSYAGLADSRGVDERSQFLVNVSCNLLIRKDAVPYLDVLSEQPVEEMNVCGLEVDEVLEFLDWGCLHGQKLETCGMISSGNLVQLRPPTALALHLEALNSRWGKAICSQVLADISGI